MYAVSCLPVPQLDDLTNNHSSVLRQIAATQPMQSLIFEELTPGPAVQSDADIDAFIYQNAGTQYHPSSTSSMLPQEKGGVVDPTLKVYGTTGLRVVDASGEHQRLVVFPNLVTNSAI